MKYRPLVAGAQSLVAAIIAGAILGSSADGSAQAVPLRLHDSNDQLIEPLQISTGTTATVFLFTSSDAPFFQWVRSRISTVVQSVRPEGCDFGSSIQNPADSPEIVRGHLSAFAYPMRALRDPEHVLVNRAKVTVTPEAAV